MNVLKLFPIFFILLLSACNTTTPVYKLSNQHDWPYPTAYAEENWKFSLLITFTNTPSPEIKQLAKDAGAYTDVLGLQYVILNPDVNSLTQTAFIQAAGRDHAKITRAR